MTKTRITMKKITNILCIAGMGMMLFSACETDRDDNPTYHDASTFTLNEPENRVYDLGANDTIRLTLTQPDYGYTAATTYLDFHRAPSERGERSVGSPIPEATPRRRDHRQNHLCLHTPHGTNHRQHVRSFHFKRSRSGPSEIRRSHPDP